MRRIYHAILLVFVSVVFFQCQKEVSYIGTPDPVVVSPAPITANLQGTVYNENNQPAAGVAIKVGNKTAITDARGYFRVHDAALDKKASLVTAEMPGYFKAFRTFSATSGTNHVSIKLIKRDVAGTIDGTTGGEVSLSNGTKVALQPNGIVNASTGAAYTGAVSVYAAYIDPTSADIDQTIPGSFMANDKNGNRVTLVSQGMVAVELQGASGEKLQIKQGSKATLTTPIPSATLSTAPATIALWYVDEQTGLWKEEGTAIKVGSAYVGEVTHFSFWNCDVGVPGIQLSMTIQNNAGLPLVHAWVKIVRVNMTNGWSAAYGWTDSLGQVGGLVPANENLILTVMDACNQPLYTQNIGPYTQNTNLGVIMVNNTTAVITIQGTLLDCNNSPVTSGYAMIYYNNMVRFAAVDANGFFEKTIITCPGSVSTYEILGVDGSANQQGPTTSGTITVPITNAGNIIACGTSTVQYIDYTFDGVAYSINNPASDSLMAWTANLQGTTLLQTQMAGSSSSASIGFRFNHSNPVAGTYQVNLIQVDNFFAGNTTAPIPVDVVVTNFPQAIGEFYEGSFSGFFVDTQTVTHTVSGTFRIRKNF